MARSPQLLVEEAGLEHGAVGVCDAREVAEDRDAQRAAVARGERGERAGLAPSFGARVQPAVKIVDITEFYSERGGGIRSHLETRGELLPTLGHDHLVVAPGPQDRVSAPAAASPRRRVVRIAGRPLPYDRTYHLLSRFDRLGAVVRSEQPDVVEAHSPYLGAAGALWTGRRVARVVTTFWHADHVGAYIEPTLRRWLGRRAGDAAGSALRRGLCPLLAPFDATFVAGAQQARMLRSIGVSPVVHVPFGVAPDFRPSAGSEHMRGRLLGDEAGAALLVAAGRLAVEKRWDVVLEAFARVRARRPAVLVIFGDGPERERLGRDAPDGVRFMGHQSDRTVLASALASADLLLHGCACETAGLGVLEAVACGLPVVVPDDGGARESAAPACSAIYRSHDPAACAAAVEALLGCPREGLRARAREAAERVPTAEQHVRAVLAAYDDLLRG